jgi:hypothetical protein
MFKAPAIAATAVSAALWSTDIIDVCTPVTLPERVFLAILAGAAMTGTMAAMLWVVDGVVRRGTSLGLLVRTVERVTRPADGAQDRPRLVK